MKHMFVNPAGIKSGDKIATKYDLDDFGNVTAVKRTRKVGYVSSCSRPEFVHLDAECYDTRFSRVVLVK